VVEVLMTADDCGAVSEHGDVCVNPADRAPEPHPEIPTSDLKES